MAESNAPGAFLFGGGHLPQTSSFRSVNQILVLSLGLVFCPPRGGTTTAGSNAPGAFLVFFWWSLAPDLCSVKSMLAGNLRLFTGYSPEFS